MESDRGAVLTVRAAARGIVDFSKVRVLDVSWWRRANILIRGMARDDELTTIRAAFDYQRSLVGNSGLTDESFKETQKTARALFREVINTVSPWAAKSEKQAHSEHMNSLLEAYKKLVGDPDDPEFRAKLLHDRQLLADGPPDKVTVEDENKRIDRLLAERDAFYAARKAGKA